MNMAYTIPPLFSRAWADQMLSRRHLSRCPWVRVLYLGLFKLQYLVGSLQKNVADKKKKKKSKNTVCCACPSSPPAGSLSCIPGSHCAFVPGLKDRQRRSNCG